MKINKDDLYLLRIDSDSFIIDGFNLDIMIESIEKSKIIEVYDIAGNYIRKPFEDNTKLAFQELYKIKSIELK